MKRLLVATSVFALALGGAAMAQSNYGAPNAAAPGANSTNTPMDSGGNVNATGSSTETQPGQGSGAGSQGSMGAQNSGAAGSQDSMQSKAPSENGSATQVSANDIRHAQRSLKHQGLYKGRIDGKFGPETRSAVNEFQKQNGLPQTASLDEQTMNDLRSAGKGMSHGGSSTGGSSNGMGGGGMQPPAEQH